MGKQKNWAGLILFFGLVLFTVSFFVPVASRIDSEGYYTGYDAIKLMLGYDRRGESAAMFTIMYILVNFSNVSVLLMLLIFIVKSAKTIYLFIPLFGLLSALIWLFKGPVPLTGYWLWIIGQVFISLAFIIEYTFVKVKRKRSYPE